MEGESLNYSKRHQNRQLDLISSWILISSTIRTQHIERFFICVLILKVQCNVIVYRGYDNFETPRKSPIAYFGAACYNSGYTTQRLWQNERLASSQIPSSHSIHILFSQIMCLYLYFGRDRVFNDVPFVQIRKTLYFNNNK